MNLGPPPKEQTYYNEKKINVPIKGPIKLYSLVPFKALPSK